MNVNCEVDGLFERFCEGLLYENELIKEFYGVYIKCLMNMIMYSKIFGSVFDDDFFYVFGEVLY